MLSFNTFQFLFLYSVELHCPVSFNFQFSKEKSCTELELEWTARISPKQLVLLDIVDNVDSPYQGEKRIVFLAILAVARMVIWETRNEGLYEGANFSSSGSDLVL